MKGKKIAKGVFVQAPLKIISLPVTIPVSKTLRTNHRYFKESTTPVDSVLCPSCGVGHLYSVDVPFRYDFEEELPPLANGQYWQCNICSEHIVTRTNNVNELIDYIEKNGRQLYEEGLAYQYRQALIDNGELDRIVDRRVKLGSLFFYGNLIALPAFLYGMFTGLVMFPIAMLLFGVLLGLIGVSHSYRAWQQYTDSLFTEYPRKQFLWWLRNRSWFLSPYAPEYQENLYYDDNEYYEDFSESEIMNFSELMFDYIEPYYEDFSESEIMNFSELMFDYIEPYY